MIGVIYGYNVASLIQREAILTISSEYYHGSAILLPHPHEPIILILEVIRVEGEKDSP